MRRDTGPKARFSQLLPFILEHRSALLLALALSLVAAAANLSQPLLVSSVISDVSAGRSVGATVWLLVGLLVFAAACSGMQYYVMTRAGEGIVLASRTRMVRRMLNWPIREYDTRRTGDLVSRVGSDTTLLRAVLTQGLVDALGGSLMFFGALIGMLIIDPVLLGITAGVVLIAIVAVTIMSSRIRYATRRAQDRVGDLAASVERALTGVRTIRAANATDLELEQVVANAEGAYRMGVQVAKYSAAIVPVAGIAMQAAFITVIGVGGMRVASGATDIAQLVTFILFLFLMIMPLGQAFGAYSSVQSALGALARIQEVLDVPTEEETPSEPSGLAPARLGAKVEYRDVSFAYEPEPGKDGAPAAPLEPVLDGVSFSLHPNTRTALVGPSGAGKSTILQLLERFYEPTGGAIFLDGADIRSMTREALRAKVGYVEQDAPVLAGTLSQNLRIAKPDASDLECLEVLERVELGDVVRRGEHGLDTQVGEGGVMLSGGERQRLAIARALLENPPILLLDESTSSLDGLTEHKLKQAIDHATEGRTVLVVAHRLATVVDSDQIVVLQDGQVVGSGTHRELLQTTPLYRALAERQLLV